jgi:colanic acid/amylovoran biosynthesis protein
MNRSVKKNQKITFLLTGTYSSFNKGDAAMQISTAEQIRQTWPDSEIVISSPFPDIDESTYAKYKLIKSSRRNIPFSTLQVVRAKAYSLFGRLGIKFAFLINNEELRHFQQADIIVDLSGDTLTEDYGPHVTYSHFLPIWLGLSFKKPVFVCAQSIGPFKLTKGFSRHMLNKVTRITAREEITRKYLDGMGVRNVETTADMAFLLQPAGEERVVRIFKEEKITEANKPVLGVTISNLVAKRFDAKNPNQDFISVTAKVLDRYITEQEANVFLLGHVTGPSDEKDDRIVVRKIKQKMKRKESAFVFNGNYSPGELKGIIARCNFFMGSRMHSNIAALSSGVPTLAIGYSHKTQGIMSLFEMNKFVCDIDTLDSDALYESLLELGRNKKSLKEKLIDMAEAVKAQSKVNVEVIKTIVENTKK